MKNDEWRNHPHYKRDPFPEIAPALLNSMDIKRYIDKECLIDPDKFERSGLQPASYQMKFLGEAHYWEHENGVLKRKVEILCEGKRFEIKKNSIVYILLKEQFRLPEYIIARFNLHIRFVHKGLLLGTGPMVHPGFFGNLFIPLHNLTDNDYMIKCGGPLIWVEFTKLSGNAYWGNAVAISEMEPRDPSKQHERPEFLVQGKTIPQHNADGYLEKSEVLLKHGVQSAFKGSLEKTQNAATRANEETKRFRNIYTWGGIVSVVAVIISIGSVIYQGNSFVGQIVGDAQEENRRQIEFNRNTQSKDVHANQKKISDLETRINLYSIEVEILKGQVNLYKYEIDAFKKQLDSFNKKQWTDNNLVQ